MQEALIYHITQLHPEVDEGVIEEKISKNKLQKIRNNTNALCVNVACII